MPASLSNSIVSLTFGSSTAEIYLHGATLTSYKPDGKEDVIFLSKKAILDGSKAIRGGIPLVFPHFGPRKPFPQHGYARLMPWKWDGILEDSEKQLLVSFSLSYTGQEINGVTWPEHAHLQYLVQLTHGSMTTSLSVRNNQHADLSFTALLHTYFDFSVENGFVEGLKGCEFLDTTVNPAATATEENERVAVVKEVDRVYKNRHDRVLTIHRGKKCLFPTLKVEMKEFCDTVVWNPWSEKAKGMADFGDDAYKHMICVEVGCVSDAVVLPPGSIWTASQTIKPVPQ